ncbi:unnamed protein product [Arabidopsis halleri]
MLFVSEIYIDVYSPWRTDTQIHKSLYMFLINSISLLILFWFLILL